jgi:hypothetical protein
MPRDVSRVLLALFACVWLTGGTQCFFAVSSGDSSDDDEPRGGLIVIINDGDLGDVPVQGVSYRSGARTGTTAANGEFRYRPGDAVAFSIGDIALGRAVAGKPLLVPPDLVDGGSVDTPEAINMTRLLLSLDAMRDDARVTIPESVRSAASLSNPEVAPAIEALDFADETAFVNAASQIVAVLTADYPFTAMLVDAETAARKLAGAAFAP